MADDSNDPEGAPDGWFAEVAAALREKPAADVARELPGLVDAVTDDEPEVDHYVVGVSFTKRHGCLDYAVDRVRRPESGEDGDGSEGPVVETVKEPASRSHRYVHFTHPPDPNFDAAALRARVLAAVDRERRNAAEPEPDRSGAGFADLWEEL